MAGIFDEPAAQPLATPESRPMWSRQFQDSRGGDFVKWSIDQDDVLLKYYRGLQGKMLVDGVWQQVSKPAMSSEGINEWMLILSQRYHKGLIMGNLDDEEAKIILKELCLIAKNFIRLNFKKFGIPKEKFDELFFGAKHLVSFGISRARNANEKRFISTIQRIEERISTPTQQGKGWLGRLFGGGDVQSPPPNY